MFDNVTLQAKHVRLEPLSFEHKVGICAAIKDGDLNDLFVTTVPNPENIDSFIQNALDMFDKGEGLAFATIDQSSNKVVGSTRFMCASTVHNKTEIGYTFIAKSFQKSAINTQAKLLMLTHVFEILELNRVEFLTDFLNNTSRNAILRLGAKQEGILRNDRVMSNGRIRDSVMFSIIKNEWSGIKQNLEFKLKQYK
ncbi:MAG: GNAT family N-acetyltransferase [Saccharospirillaceae bacterium]|nr:GNAT family N-acetyltransferase [Pseudomonadales bacterium]NRB81211.1 GNAT family N-acetyltransferase [Saccharospirillaceae bacterium]